MRKKAALSDKDVLEVLNSGVTPRVAADGVFEIGLVLGGTVAAGAYTAGVLDKLVEALDAWYAAKAAGADVPTHDVNLRVACGASGGAVCAAILARALSYRFPHITPTSAARDWARNPFYKLWVEDLDVGPMLDTADLGAGPITALFNGALLDRKVNEVAEYVGDPLASGSRLYVDNPFRAIITLANLTGTVLGIDFGGNERHHSRSHADYARFACEVTAAGTGGTPASLRPDEFFVQEGGGARAVSWQTLATYARASGAFPGAFRPGELTRPASHYDYRMAVIPGPDGAAEPRRQVPLWPAGQPADYPFLVVDGGTFNNEPIELARTFLAGLTGRNPRDAKAAHRAILLIDPLPSNSDSGPARFPGLLKLAGATISALVANSRYATADLMLMADPEVFSRFQVLPERGGITGDLALTTAGLGAFLGFFEKSFRRYDYMLGRANCHRFLAGEFVLGADNPVVSGRYTDAQRKQYAAAAGDGFVPIIPLVGRAAVPDGPLPLPVGKLTARQVRSRLQPRIEAIVRKALDEAIDIPLSDLLLLPILTRGISGRVLDDVETAAARDLAARGL
ncbi:patatin-like phospholipase family protein [Azospirillum doebereinerae]